MPRQQLLSMMGVVVLFVLAINTVTLMSRRDTAVSCSGEKKELDREELLAIVEQYLNGQLAPPSSPASAHSPSGTESRSYSPPLVEQNEPKAPLQSIHTGAAGNSETLASRPAVDHQLASQQDATPKKEELDLPAKEELRMIFDWQVLPQLAPPLSSPVSPPPEKLAEKEEGDVPAKEELRRSAVWLELPQQLAPLLSSPVPPLPSRSPSRTESRSSSIPLVGPPKSALQNLHEGTSGHVEQLASQLSIDPHLAAQQYAPPLQHDPKRGEKGEKDLPAKDELTAPSSSRVSPSPSPLFSPPPVKQNPPMAALQNPHEGTAGNPGKPVRQAIDIHLAAQQYTPPLRDPKRIREARYATKYAGTVRDLELLAPDLQVPVDTCRTVSGFPCVRGDVVLLHQGRCGSHALMEPLGLHPATEEEEARFPWGFSRFAEAFNVDFDFVWHKYTGHHREEMLEHGLRQVTARLDEVRQPDKLYFLSLKINQIALTGLTTHDFLTLLAAYGFRHLIIIYRNPIRVRASYQAAGARRKEGVKNPFHEREEENANCRPVEIPVSKIYRDFDITERAYQESLEHPAFRNAISLQYERDLYDDPHRTAQRVLRELGLVVPARRMGLLKTTDCPLAEIVENWEEVKKFVEGTAYDWALELNGVQEPLPRATEELLRMCRVKPTDTRPAFVRCEHTLPVWQKKMGEVLLSEEELHDRLINEE